MNVFSKQKTIKDKVKLSGIGLHSGKPTKIVLIPQNVNTGINFIFNNKKIKASWKNGEVSQLCTKIKNKKTYISTIEHLMSSLSGLGITNLCIETSSEEIPILDGSAKFFVNSILDSGIKEQNEHQKKIIIKKRLLIRQMKNLLKLFQIIKKN